ncbi:hypothetical protein COT50_01710 [candidate division WWE3 bacterium CG08_land_8_20_14_0_20_41_10]|uniref:Uncharacterized protein n=1 Tax=candidate division WWE3 bacterium CG08_land_8_20_14_0_20_41_10 TaxID=1975085 RepID=A0A2H0XC29_UNCKA|nr:MAG: hypothetical protein COT50_01710 [candidate division WWE3 bacterium CG08_land_8_20_14_0_20_41_10]
MEKPYLRKLEDVGVFEIWEVDGMYVRSNLNREFTNFGQHFRFPFIPKHQFWIDEENSNNETTYYVNHMLVEWHLMDRGADYDTAITKADKQEQAERKKSALMEKVRTEITSTNTKIPKEVYVHKLTGSESPQIWIVNGELVRDLYFIDFTEGGHHFVYDFVPYNKVWLDNDLVPAEREFVLLHELHERYLMFKGMDYNHAHNSSSYIEYQCRCNPGLLSKSLEKEITNNALIKPEFVSAIA